MQIVRITYLYCAQTLRLIGITINVDKFKYIRNNFKWVWLCDRSNIRTDTWRLIENAMDDGSILTVCYDLLVIVCRLECAIVFVSVARDMHWKYLINFKLGGDNSWHSITPICKDYRTSCVKFYRWIWENHNKCKPEQKHENDWWQ